MAALLTSAFYIPLYTRISEPVSADLPKKPLFTEEEGEEVRRAPGFMWRGQFRFLKIL